MHSWPGLFQNGPGQRDVLHGLFYYSDGAARQGDGCVDARPNPRTRAQVDCSAASGSFIVIASRMSR